jgi:predicted MFS family arabinose efflux permease
MAQVVLSLGVKQVLQTMDWRTAMVYLAFIVLGALLLATALAKRNPEDYGIEAFGLPPAGAAAAKPEHIWKVREAFGTLPIWGAVLAFLTSMIAEFLIWTQVVMYWTQDIGMSLNSATNLYVAIGIAGIFSMPLMGIVADRMVVKMGNEVLGRKIMLIVAPAVGIVACILLLMTGSSIIYGLIACILFSVYWAIEPGGVVGYAGAIYGRVSLGKIWGFATLIVMGIGPAVGSFMGGYLYDTSGDYVQSINFAMGAFALSAIIAWMLPRAVAVKETDQAIKDAK